MLLIIKVTIEKENISLGDYLTLHYRKIITGKLFGFIPIFKFVGEFKQNK